MHTDSVVSDLGGPEKIREVAKCKIHHWASLTCKNTPFMNEKKTTPDGQRGCILPVCNACWLEYINIFFKVGVTGLEPGRQPTLALEAKHLSITPAHLLMNNAYY